VNSTETRLERLVCAILPALLRNDEQRTQHAGGEAMIRMAVHLAKIAEREIQEAEKS
jgi:hypothetical protein